MADNQNPDDPNRPQPASLPVYWKTGGKVVSKTRSPIHMPGAQEVATYGAHDVKTCGSCRHFRGGEQQSKADSNAIGSLVRAAVKENGWKRIFFGQPPESLRRCAEDAELAVGPQSRACSRYTPRR